ncbi:hypothetical protein EDC04DRAFT_2673673 [Pisolithus marmoratus]|nr:hypothetical protein EDC04DRAFT_2673673 [Pisolithus marmoratus]
MCVSGSNWSKSSRWMTLLWLTQALLPVLGFHPAFCARTLRTLLVHIKHGQNDLLAKQHHTHHLVNSRPSSQMLSNNLDRRKSRTTSREPAIIAPDFNT